MYSCLLYTSQALLGLDSEPEDKPDEAVEETGAAETAEAPQAE